MRTVRVYAGQPLSTGATVELPDDAVRHIGRVLRMRTGDSLVLFDGSGSDYAATLTAIDRNAVSALVAARLDNVAESPLDVSLWHGLCRSSRMDYVVQKATELGVSEIQPLVMERSVVRLDDSRAAKKLRHWQGIAVGAAEQSGRSRIPTIHAPAKLATCLANMPADSTAVLLHPGEHPGLAAQVAGAGRVILLTGPEGGFTDEEIAAALAAGLRPATLGPRILRSETAPVAALAIIQSVSGDLA